MLKSLDKVLDQPQLRDTGLPQQLLLFEQLVQKTGQTPLVIDSVDLLKNPEGMLRKLTAELQLDFSPTMLSWPAGSRDTDGVWARHWYSSVNQSTGFKSARTSSKSVPDHLQELYQHCLPFYNNLHAQRITV